MGFKQFQNDYSFKKRKSTDFGGLDFVFQGTYLEVVLKNDNLSLLAFLIL